jgi:hypothetical protein
MAEDKEINGLSFCGCWVQEQQLKILLLITLMMMGLRFGVGRSILPILLSQDCTDDYFDIDDGYAGTVKNLVIKTTTGNAAIEMSGQTAATFDGFEYYDRVQRKQKRVVSSSKKMVLVDTLKMVRLSIMVVK